MEERNASILNFESTVKTKIYRYSDSYLWMDGDRILLKKLVNAGFEIFAFHVGFDDGKNETHVVCHERNYFYGLYADDWNFSQIPEC